jgi:endo-1,4-beta-xylanase
VNRRSFLQRTSAAAAFLIAPARRGAAAQLRDEDVLEQCKDRIHQHRRGAGVVQVRHADGRPVGGATVKVEQLRHDFLFGCNFFMFRRLRETSLNEEYQRRFRALLNYATLGFYWPSYEPERGKPAYEYTDKVTAWAAEHGIRCKGHPLVWDFSDPPWLPQEYAEIRTLSNAHVRDIVSRFKGRIGMWDVVNEPTHLGRFKTRLGEWAISMGAVPYVKEHLRLAREANPSATLLVNDYRTDPPYYAILDQLRDEEHLLFDAIGIQSHMHDGGWPLRKVWQTCDSYAKLGLPLHFTETTIVSGPRTGPGENWGGSSAPGEAAQAEYVPKFYTALFAHPSVDALTWWDFSDNGAWQRAPAGLLRKDMSPKPVYDRLMDLVKGQWWTRTEGRTDQNGEFRTRAFFGQHRVSLEAPGGLVLDREVHWKRGDQNRFSFTVA